MLQLILESWNPNQDLIRPLTDYSYRSRSPAPVGPGAGLVIVIMHTILLTSATFWCGLQEICSQWLWESCNYSELCPVYYLIIAAPFRSAQSGSFSLQPAGCCWAGWAGPGWAGLGCAGLGWAGHCHNNPCQVHSSDSPILDTNLFLIEESPITFTFSTCLVSLCGGGGQQVGTARVEAAAAHWRLLFDHGGGGGGVRSGGCWRCWLGE